MCVGPFNPPKEPEIAPVPATPEPQAVFGQRVTLSATETAVQQGTAPSARSAGSLYVPMG